MIDSFTAATPNILENAQFQWCAETTEAGTQTPCSNEGVDSAEELIKTHVNVLSGTRF